MSYNLYGLQKSVSGSGVSGMTRGVSSLSSFLCSDPKCKIQGYKERLAILDYFHVEVAKVRPLENGS